ncbi:MAG: heterodisulfide reductase-related iron-sulfur binding cluster [Rhodospirillales bacterium]
MREGSLEAPIRRPIRWRDEEFYDPEKLDAELRRVFDICHGCRRCFNLCDSFPRLFDLVDESTTGELDAVASVDFKKVVDACTLCDMCFMTKCPYVPPHEFDLDFPHLMVRYRAVERRQGKVPFAVRQLTETDRNGKLAAPLAPIANWATRCGNTLTRPLLENVAGVHRDAHLPAYHGATFERRARREPPAVDRTAPAFGRKAVIYATCFINYNNPDIGTAARAVLARNGVETEVVYPSCCGMPQLEHGDLARVAGNARKVAAALRPWIDKGYDVVSLVPSCSLMLKFEWPLLEPDDENVEVLSGATFDVAEFVVDIARKEGLAGGLQPLPGGITVHIACHARAQNMGQKAAELLRLLPETDVAVIERCSGHGGSWGIMKDNFEVAMKVGRPVARQAVENGSAFVVSECPLARDHVIQGMERLDTGAPAVEHVQHPIQLIARGYGL